MMLMSKSVPFDVLVENLLIAMEEYCNKPVKENKVKLAASCYAVYLNYMADGVDEKEIRKAGEKAKMAERLLKFDES